jgi:hypothetical protein
VHTITFQPIPWGISPSNAVVTITSNQTLTATYTHVFASLQITLGPTKAVQAGAAWQLDGGNWQSNGATLSAIPYGQHQLNFSNIPGWQTLPTYSFTIDNPTNSMRFTYTAIDTTPPAVSILSPKPGQQWTNQVFTTRGVARDNVAVASVWYQINGNGWNQAIGTNSWSSLPVVLPSGPSAVQACAVDTSGNVSKTITTRFDNAPEAPLTLTVNGNGTVSPKSGVHYLYLGKPYSFTAIPGEKTAFAGWSGAAVSDDFTMTITIETNAILQANFVPNPLAPAAGAYEGLFYSPNTIAPPSSGFFSAVVAPSGAFSGKLLFESGSSSISGRFSSSGQSSNFIPRAMNPIALTMSLDITNRRITGDLQTPNWVALLQAYAASFSKSNPAPWAGSYAMQILPGQGFGTIPAKNGSGLVSVGATGNVTFSGTLGDGTRVSQSAILSPQGQWPFFQSLYFGSGVILGWLNLTNSPADLSGELMWIKTPATNATGFFATNEVQGSVRTNK